MISKKLKAYCKDIGEWPDSWKYDKPDIVTGEKILRSETEMDSFDSSCRKLYKFLKLLNA